jgi:bifunctional ADP-heptose synthase (sugar kinase/adenylyltransferase)
MSLVSRDAVVHIPTEAKEVYDVSGAGDTVVGTLATALSSGMELVDSVGLANKAAGIVVSKIGTAPIRIEKLNDCKRLEKL